jgi:DNA-binding MarR family transcriptional regulator
MKAYGISLLCRVERTVSPNDRREVLLHLTQKGKEASEKASKNALSYKAMRSVLRHVSDEEIVALLHIHKEILHRLEQTIDNEAI